MINITPVPALHDNYIWVIHNDHQAIVVDPGEATPALNFLARHKLELTSILCTHRHHDHINGIAALREVYNVPVYGRRHPNNPHITFELQEGDTLNFDAFDLTFNIIEVPGHLVDHIAFLTTGLVFCGDILFGAGCGRNFEGSPAQLLNSLHRLAQLPDDTQVYCAHEFTAANLRFALACEPGNPAVSARIEATRQLRDAKLPTIPTNIALEKATNPFLRCTQPEIIHTLQQRGLEDTSELGVFTAMRAWKNNFPSAL